MSAHSPFQLQSSEISFRLPSNSDLIYFLALLSIRRVFTRVKINGKAEQVKQYDKALVANLVVRYSSGQLLWTPASQHHRTDKEEERNFMTQTTSMSLV